MAGMIRAGSRVPWEAGLGAGGCGGRPRAGTCAAAARGRVPRRRGFARMRERPGDGTEASSRCSNLHRATPGRGSGEAVAHLHAADGAAACVTTSLAAEVPPGAIAAEPAVVDALAGSQAAAAGVADDGACLEPARVGCLPRRAEVRRDGGLQVECGHRFVPVSYTHLRAHETRHDLV